MYITRQKAGLFLVPYVLYIIIIQSVNFVNNLYAVLFAPMLPIPSEFLHFYCSFCSFYTQLFDKCWVCQENLLNPPACFINDIYISCRYFSNWNSKRIHNYDFYK